MSRPLTLAELHCRNLRAKANLPRRPPSPSRHDGPNLRVLEGSEKDTSGSTDIFDSTLVNTIDSTGASELLGPSVAHVIELVSGESGDEAVGSTSQLSKKHPSIEGEPSSLDLVEENVQVEAAFRLCLEALQIPAQEIDKCDEKALHSRQEGSHLSRIENEEKGCVNKDLQGLKGEQLVCRKTGSGASSSSTKSGRISKRSSSVSSSSSKSSSSRLRQPNRSNCGPRARSNSRKRGRSSSRDRGRSRCRLRSNSRHRGRSMSGHRGRSRSRNRVRSRSRHQTRSSSRHRVGSYSASRGQTSSGPVPRGRSKSRTRNTSINKKRTQSSRTNKGKTTSFKQSKSPVRNPRRLIRTKNNEVTINVTLFNDEMQKKKVDLSLGSLIQSSAKMLHQQDHSLSIKKKQAVKVGLSSSTPNQVENVLTNGVKRKELPLAASLTLKEVESPFSPAVQRFLELFNLSGLDQSEDDASDEENKSSQLASKSQKENLDSAKEKKLENSSTIENGAMLRCNKNGTLPKLAAPVNASVQRDSVAHKDSVVNQQSPATNPEEHEYEMIQEVLKEIGLNIGVTEIGKLSTRAQGRKNEQKVSVGSSECHRPAESSIHSSSSTVGGSSYLAKCKDMVAQTPAPLGQQIPTPAIVSEVKTPGLGHKSPTSALIQQIPSPVIGQQVPALDLGQQMKGPILAEHHAPINSAPPIVNASPTTAPVYYTANYTPAQVPQNYPPLIPGTPSVYSQYVPTPSWTSCPPDQQLNMSHTPTLPPAINVNTPIVGTGASMHLPIPAREPLSDEKNEEFQKKKVIEDRQKLKAERETRQMKIAFLEKELERTRKQLAETYLVKRQDRDGHPDLALKKVTMARDYLFGELNLLKKEETLAAETQSELDAIAEIMGIDTGKPRKQSTDRKRERSRSQEKPSRRGRSKSQEKTSKRERSRSPEKLSYRGRSRSQEKTSKGMKSKTTEKSRPQTKHSNSDMSRNREKSTSPATVTADLQGSCQTTKSSNDKTSKFIKSPSHSAVQAAGVYEYYDAGSHWCRECNTVCGTMLDFFSHLHHKKHQQTLDPDTRPWASKTLSEMNQETSKDPNKVTLPAKGSEFVVPLKAYYCKLCGEISGDKIGMTEHVKCSNHNQNYKKYIDQHLLYEERRNLDRQAGLAAAMEAKRRREREMKHKLQEDLQEDEKGSDPKLAKKVNDQGTHGQNKVTISKETSQKILNRNSIVKQEDTESGLEKSEEVHTAGNDVDGNSCTDTQKTTQVQDGKLKPISITISKKPVLYVQSKIRPNLPAPCMVPRQTITANIFKPAPLNTFLSIKTGPTTKPLTLGTNVSKPENIFVPDKPKGTDIGLVPLKKTESSLKALVAEFSDQTPKPTWRVAVEHRVGFLNKPKQDFLNSDKQEPPTVKFQTPAASLALGNEELTKEIPRDNSEAPNCSSQTPIVVGAPLQTSGRQVKQSNEVALGNLRSSTYDRPTDVLKSARTSESQRTLDPWTAKISREGETVPLSVCQEFIEENTSQTDQADVGLKRVSFPIAVGPSNNEKPNDDLTKGNSYIYVKRFDIAPQSDLLGTQIDLCQKQPSIQSPAVSNVSGTFVTLTEEAKQEQPVLDCLNEQDHPGNFLLDLSTQQVDVEVSEADELLVPEEDAPMPEVSSVSPALNLGNLYASDNFTINVKLKDGVSDTQLTSGQDHLDKSVIKLTDQVSKVERPKANYFDKAERTTAFLREQSPDLSDKNPWQTQHPNKMHLNVLAIGAQGLRKLETNLAGTYSDIVERGCSKLLPTTLDESSERTKSPFVTSEGVIKTAAESRTLTAKEVSGNVLTGSGGQSSLVLDPIVDNPNSPEDSSEEAAYLSD